MPEAIAGRQPLSLLMVDADHFKRINDRFGHLVGDKVLVGMATLLQDCFPHPNFVGRYGGEEFCIAVVGLGEAEVERLVERIRLAVFGDTTWLPNGERTTVSIGMSTLGYLPCSLTELVKRADDALYAAKFGGRNRFVNWRHLSSRPTAQQTGKSLSSAG
jgi:diguanylate cyclase (GGDEF)-like protein